ncbi:EpsG family protein [Lactococcus lactis]|uniref:EpsG family protein n=1 Tax=Lactococcus lactis TaxID=1358 RepID=UPI0028916AF5|nr:EpsG family protein [Lactococcus lactis]MDT2872721.1 EpsG family protein [Lactococcus lactis]
MIYYILAILLSLGISYFVSFFKKRKFFYTFFLFLSILPTSILAGVRDYSVGVDVGQYVTTNFGQAILYGRFWDFQTYLNFFKHRGGIDWVTRAHSTEMGYNVLTFIVSRFYNNAHWLMFYIQLTIGIFVILIAIKLNKMFDTSIPFTLFIYYSGFYIFGLNMMRQSIAALIMIYAFLFFIQKRYISYSILQLIAASFHVSAWIGIIIVLTHFIIVNSKKEKKLSYKDYSIIGMICIVFVSLFGSVIFGILSFIISIIPFLSYHMSSVYVSDGTPIRRVIVFVLWAEVYLIYLAFSSKTKNRKIIDNNLFEVTLRTSAIITILGIILSMTMVYTGTLYRLGINFNYIQITALPLVLKRFNRTAIGKMKLGIIIFGIIIFGYFIYSKFAATSPYTSQILDGYLTNW